MQIMHKFCLKAPTTSQALGLLHAVICPGCFDIGGYDEAQIPNRLAVNTTNEHHAQINFKI